MVFGAGMALLEIMVPEDDPHVNPIGVKGRRDRDRRRGRGDRECRLPCDRQTHPRLAARTRKLFV